MSKSARYRSKDETDLVWNRTRRRITRDLDTRLMDFREELLNRTLTAAWEKYSESLDTGSLVQLEDEATFWLETVLTKQLQPIIENDLEAVLKPKPVAKTNLGGLGSSSPPNSGWRPTLGDLADS